MAGRVRVYLGASYDTKIAGEGNDLGWLDRVPERQAETPMPVGPDEPLTFEGLLAASGALLFGRTTFDVVRSFGGPWPYGDLPVLVATSRPLDEDLPTARAVAGTAEELVAAAREVAGEKDVYADGGDLVRQLLAAGLVDELTLSFLPTVRGGGIDLFERLGVVVDVDVIRLATLDDRMVQVTMAPHRPESA